jgi:lysophospholipid acyltransferase (LPLAT)-like uncharacterized protein
MDPPPKRRKHSAMRRRLRRWKYAILERVAVPAAHLLVRLYGLTIRVTWENPEAWEAMQRQPLVLCFWHGSMVSISLVARGPGRRLLHNVTVMTSPSRDGQLNGKFLQRLGCRVITGSSSKSGSEALLGMRREIHAGHHAGIAVDGPRGPRGVPKAGAALLAKSAKTPMMALDAVARRSIHLPDWARTSIPLPFTRVAMRARLISPPVDLRVGLDELESALTEFSRAG